MDYSIVAVVAFLSGMALEKVLSYKGD